jgi:hypothetical protein
MSLIQYKFTKLYSKFLMLYTKRKEKNMDKTIKFPAILLFVFLFFIIKEVASIPRIPFTTTTIKCKSSRDCPDCVLPKQDMVFSVCQNGYCLEISTALKPKF